MPWVEKRGKQRVVRWKTTNPDGSETVHASGRLTEPKAKALVAKLRAKLPDQRRRKAGLRVRDQSIAALCGLWRQAKTQENEASANYAKEAAAKAEALADAAGILTVSQATGERIRTHRSTAGTACHRSLAYLRGVLRWAVDELAAEVDPRFFTASRPPPSAESEHPLLTDDQRAAIEAEARRLDQWPLVRCLSLYGWRPITACRILGRHIDIKNATATLKVKRAKRPHVHPLHPEIVELLRPRAEVCGPDEPFFLNRAGVPWRTRGDDADGVTCWYRDRLQHLAPEAGGTNALKRWALSAMERGLPPWPRPLTLREIRLFSGHKTDSQAARYLRASTEEAARLVTGGRGSSVVDIAKPGATGPGFTQPQPGHGGLSADDSVTFSTR